ncbi:hypothetical protein [uncultured Shewanella sp.]|uniref:hypothetical protein n=1 Tax=uncultured Shewanella sp. TaxID=173975 RepID=UPI0026248AB0|nr:hypothetical protein [uncultured Shewanella sp.]
MQLNKIALFFIGIVSSYSSYAEQKDPDNLAFALAKYEKESKICSKYNISDFKTKNTWFDSLSDDDKKTAIYYIVTSLKEQCLQPLENELIVAFFYDAAITNSNEKLLTYLEMVRIALPSQEDKRLIEKKVNKLNSKQLDILKEEIKSSI